MRRGGAAALCSVCAHSQLYAAQIRHRSLLLLCARCCRFLTSLSQLYALCGVEALPVSLLCSVPTASSMRRRYATGLCFCSVLGAVVSSLLSVSSMRCRGAAGLCSALLCAHSQLYAAQRRCRSLLLLCTQCCQFMASSNAAQRHYRPLLLLYAQCYISAPCLCFKSQVRFAGRLLSALCYLICASGVIKCDARELLPLRPCSGREARAQSSHKSQVRFIGRSLAI
jgi:hypothetical protein